MNHKNLIFLRTIIINIYCTFKDKRSCYKKLDDQIRTVIEKWPSHDLIVVGDLQLHNQRIDELSNMCINYNLLQQVTLPTCVTNTQATQIDHVYSKSNKALQTEVIICDISDHYPTLTKYPTEKALVRVKNNETMAQRGVIHGNTRST